MSLYSLNKDMLIKIISDVNNLKNYPREEIDKIKDNCILELRNRNMPLSTAIASNRKKRIVRALEFFHNILLELVDTEEHLYIDFTVHDIKNHKMEHWIFSIIYHSGENYISRYLDDAYLCLYFGGERFCLTTSLEYFNPLCNLVLLVTEIAIFHSSNQIYVEMEKH